MTIVPRAAVGALSLALVAAVACGGGATHEASSSSVTVAISPQTVALAPSAPRQFQATVTGTADTSVTWGVAEGAAGGSVTSVGLYTAPSAQGTFHVVVTSVADPTKSASAQVMVTTASADLCAGLVQDKGTHPMTAVAKPAVRQAFVDPQFGTTIRRVTDAAAGGLSFAIPVYSTIQAWNADESYLILYQSDGNHHLYDGKTYAHLKTLSAINPADLEQVYWDTSDPKILYYANRTTRILYAYNVDTGAQTAVHDFKTAPSSCTTDLTGGVDPMWTSWDSNYFGFVCGSKHFSYRKDTDTVGTVATISSGGNQPAPGPSGQLYFLNRADTAAQVRDVDMNLARTITGISSAEHASLGSSNGADTLFSVQWDTYTGTVVASDLATGVNRVIVGPDTGWPDPPSGTHLSAVAYKNPGWLTSSIIGASSGAGVLDQEILLVNANTGGSICRVGHHRSTTAQAGYWAEPHATISPRGTRILFGSDWGGGATVDTYVVELPSYAP